MLNDELTRHTTAGPRGALSLAGQPEVPAPKKRSRVGSAPGAGCSAAPDAGPLNVWMHYGSDRSKVPPGDIFQQP